MGDGQTVKVNLETVFEVGERPRVRSRLVSRAVRVLCQRVSTQVQRRLEAAVAEAANGGLCLVDEAHVLAQVGRVGVAAAAARTTHAARF